jgi:hypothetical protein
LYVLCFFIDGGKVELKIKRKTLTDESMHTAGPLTVTALLLLPPVNVNSLRPKNSQHPIVKSPQSTLFP